MGTLGRLPRCENLPIAPIELYSPLYGRLPREIAPISPIENSGRRIDMAPSGRRYWRAYSAPRVSKRVS